MSHTLPSLPYAHDALAPHIDAKTMEIHHGKHHNAYVTNLNAALEGNAGLAGKSLDDLMKSIGSVPEKIRTAVRNNGGGHWNHSLFWTILSGNGGGEANGPVGDAIDKTFGEFDTFRVLFSKAAVTRFGSGWAWLSLNGEGKLEVSSTPNQENPLMEGKTPILGLDVWEHAYYLNYQNRRPDYVAAWWNLIDWNEVNRRFEEATG